MYTTGFAAPSGDVDELDWLDAAAAVVVRTTSGAYLNENVTRNVQLVNNWCVLSRDVILLACR